MIDTPTRVRLSQILVQDLKQMGIQKMISPFPVRLSQILVQDLKLNCNVALSSNGKSDYHKS